MTPAHGLTLWGGILLLVGLLMALIANWVQAKVMGDAGLGVGMWAPDKDSPEWRRKERLRTVADWWFWIGAALTAIGIALQTWGAMWPTSS